MAGNRCFNPMYSSVAVYNHVEKSVYIAESLTQETFQHIHVFEE